MTGPRAASWRILVDAGLLQSSPRSPASCAMSEPLDEGSAAPRPPAPETAAPPDPGRRRRAALAAALVAIAIALGAAWLDVRNTQRAQRLEFAKRIAEIETSDQAARTAFKEMQEGQRENQAKLALLESRLAESQSQQAALEALYRELAPSHDEWALTEIEQMLLLASQQLQLAGSVSSALAALQLADAKLQRLDRPQFAPLRRALARDMERLKAVPYVDITGLSLRLDQAIAAVDTLPLALEGHLPATGATAAPKADSPWRRFLSEIWQDLRQLVRVENLDRPEPPLLAPQQQYFLRENLKLRLLAGRFDLYLRDQTSFRNDLAAADEWLRKYFDTRSQPVQAVQMLLKQVQATDMATDVPDVNRSLEAVRLLKLARDKPQR
jgi:uroporphyrin-3 C-methyltransferase